MVLYCPPFIAISIWARFRPWEYWTRGSRRTFARTDMEQHIRVVTLLLFCFFWLIHDLWWRIYANWFSASRRRCWSRDWGFPGNCCPNSSAPLTNAALSDIECKMKLKWYPKCWEDSQCHSEIQWYKTPAPGFDFEMCSAHVYSTKSKAFGKSICVGQFWYCGGRHK